MTNVCSIGQRNTRSNKERVLLLSSNRSGGALTGGGFTPGKRPHQREPYPRRSDILRTQDRSEDNTMQTIFDFVVRRPTSSRGIER